MTWNYGQEQPQGTVTFSTVGPGAGFVFQNPMTTIGHVISGGAAGIVATSGVASGNVSANQGNDTCGRVYFSSSTSPALGAQVLVLFAQPYGAQPYADVTPLTATTAFLLPFVTTSTNSFTFSFGTAPATSASYSFTYQVSG